MTDTSIETRGSEQEKVGWLSSAQHSINVAVEDRYQQFVERATQTNPDQALDHDRLRQLAIRDVRSGLNSIRDELAKQKVESAKRKTTGLDSLEARRDYLGAAIATGTPDRSTVIDNFAAGILEERGLDRNGSYLMTPQASALIVQAANELLDALDPSFTGAV